MIDISLDFGEPNSALRRDLKNLEILVLRAQHDMKKALESEQKYTINWFKCFKRCDEVLDLCLFELAAKISGLGFVSIAKIYHQVQAARDINMKYIEKGYNFLLYRNQKSLNEGLDQDSRQHNGLKNVQRPNLHIDAGDGSLMLAGGGIESNQGKLQTSRIVAENGNFLAQKQTEDYPEIDKTRNLGSLEKDFKAERNFSRQVESLLKNKPDLPQSKIFNLVSHLDGIVYQVGDGRNLKVRISNEPIKFKRAQSEQDSDDELSYRCRNRESNQFLIKPKKEAEQPVEEIPNDTEETQASNVETKGNKEASEDEFTKLQKQLRTKNDAIIDLRKNLRKQEHVVENLKTQLKHQNLLKLQLDIDLKGMKLIFDEESERFQDERRKNHELIERIAQLERGYEQETASFMQAIVDNITLQVENKHMARLIKKLEKRAANALNKKKSTLYHSKDLLSVHQPSVNRRSDAGRKSRQDSHDRDTSVLTHSSRDEENHQLRKSRTSLETFPKQDYEVDGSPNEGQSGNTQIYWNGKGYSFNLSAPKEDSNAGSFKRRDSSRMTTQIGDEIFVRPSDEQEQQHEHQHQQQQGKHTSYPKLLNDKTKPPKSPLKVIPKRESIQNERITSMRKSMLNVTSAQEQKIKKRVSSFATLRKDTKVASLSDRTHYVMSKELPVIKGLNENTKGKNDDDSDIEPSPEKRGKQEEDDDEDSDEKTPSYADAFNNTKTSKSILSKFGNTKTQWGVLTKPLSQTMYKGRSQSNGSFMAGQIKLEDLPEVSINGLTQSLIIKGKEKDNSIESISRIYEQDNTRNGFDGDGDNEDFEGKINNKINKLIQDKYNKLDWREEKQIKDLYECLTQSTENIQVYASWLKEIAIKKKNDTSDNSPLSKLEIEVDYMQALKSLSSFTNFYLRCIEMHRQCGAGCIHLSRLKDRVKVMISNKLKKKSKNGKIEAVLGRIKHH